MLISEAQRNQQAQLVNNFVDDILAQDRRANVVVLGDFNDFQFSTPQRILRGLSPDARTTFPYKNDRLSRHSAILKDLAGSLQSFDYHSFILKKISRALHKLLYRKGKRGKSILTSLVSTLRPTERYSFNFGGNSQALDNIHVSKSLARFAKVDIVHVNSEFFDQASDHDPVVSQVIPRPSFSK